MTDIQIISNVRSSAMTAAVKNLEDSLAYLRSAKNTLLRAYADDNHFIVIIREMDLNLAALVIEARREREDQSLLAIGEKPLTPANP